MKVILKKDVTKLGESGEVVDVKPGFARNYLLPQGLAYVASEANLQRVEEERQRAEERARRDYLEGRRRAAQLDGTSLTFEVKASEEGRLFGSVTSADIAQRLNELAIDFEVDKREVLLEEPIKSLGAFQVPVHLGREVEAEVEVRVEREAES